MRVFYDIMDSVSRARRGAAVSLARRLAAATDECVARSKGRGAQSVAGADRPGLDRRAPQFIWECQRRAPRPGSSAALWGLRSSMMVS